MLAAWVSTRARDLVLRRDLLTGWAVVVVVVDIGVSRIARVVGRNLGHADLRVADCWAEVLLQRSLGGRCRTGTCVWFHVR
jgi:hypothetical protein